MIEKLFKSKQSFHITPTTEKSSISVGIHTTSQEHQHHQISSSSSSVKMSPTSSRRFAFGSILVAGTCAVLCVAIFAQAQYNTYDSDSNSDSEGGPILSNAEIGRLVRNSANKNNYQQHSGANLRNNNKNHHHHQQQQLAAATRNLYNKQQPLQYAPTQHRRQYGSSDGLSGYSAGNGGPIMGASNGRGASANNDDDDESGNFGPNFGANFDGGDNDGEAGANSNADGQPMNLNQAASGYPSQGGDYNENAAAFGTGFGGAGGSSGYGPSSYEGAEFGPSSEFGGGEGRRAKSASSLMGSRNYGSSDDDAGAPQYGPNSAVNSGDNDDEGRAGYAPEGGNDNDGDDE